MILDLGLGERGLVMHAPVDGLEALVDVAVAVHAAEHADLVGLEAGIHRAVEVLPVGDHAHALEAGLLALDIVLGIVAAGAAEVRNAHVLVVEALLLDDGALDGHAVVIPAGDIGHLITAHHVAAVDEILERLVQRVTHVDIAVGERRAVVQVEAGLALALLERDIVNVLLIPALEHVGLALRETCAHGEVGLRQVDGLVEVVFVLCHGSCAPFLLVWCHPFFNTI